MPRKFKDKPSEERWQIRARAIKLGLDDGAGNDAAYRDVLWTLARVTSARELDAAGRKKVLAHLDALGGGQKRPTRRPATRPDTAAMMRKVDALLAEIGARRGYADGMARNMFGVDFAHWLNAGQMHKLVAALQIHVNRKDRRVMGPVNHEQ